MVDPDDVTKFDRTTAELEEFLLFCIVVAGKTAYIQTQKLDDWILVNREARNETSFDIIRRLGPKLRASIKKAKLGQYNRLTPLFKNLAWSGIDLRTCTTSELEVFNGIGPKTSRFFILHSRSGQRFAVLDTHILSWMREKGIPCPKNTPQGTRKYADLETKFIGFCDQMGKTPEELDLEIWSSRARRAPAVAS